MKAPRPIQQDAVRILCPRHRLGFWSRRCKDCGRPGDDEFGTIPATLIVGEIDRLIAPYLVALNYAVQTLSTVAGAEPTLNRIEGALRSRRTWRGKGYSVDGRFSVEELEARDRTLAIRLMGSTGLNYEQTIEVRIALLRALDRADELRRAYENDRHDALLDLGIADRDLHLALFPPSEEGRYLSPNRSKIEEARGRQVAAMARLDRLDGAIARVDSGGADASAT